MADLTITAANVASGTTGTELINKDYKAGAAAAAGQTVYLDATTTPPTWKLADADLAAARSPSGIALHTAAIGQPLAVQTSGPITIGAALTPGLFYYQSKTAGGIAPIADITGTGTYPTVIGPAISASQLRIDISESGVAL